MTAPTRTPRAPTAASRRKDTEVRALTLGLDPEPFRQLALLAAAKNRSSTNYVETPVLREIEACSEGSGVIRMLVAPEAVDLDPGSLRQGKGATPSGESNSTSCWLFPTRTERPRAWRSSRVPRQRALPGRRGATVAGPTAHLLLPGRDPAARNRRLNDLSALAPGNPRDSLGIRIGSST